MSDIPLEAIKPTYPPTPIPRANASHESPSIQSLISSLNLIPHPEGGYFVETDRNPLRIANPYHDGKITSINNEDPETFSRTSDLKANAPNTSKNNSAEDNDTTRSASTSIYYLLTPGSPLGAFHRNKSRTVHTLHRGRGRYVIIHADRARRAGANAKAEIETFVVGQNVEKGERLQWIVEGGEYKATFLLPDRDEGGLQGSGGLLISETVVPGFDFADHDFLEPEGLERLLEPEQV
ncbi:RmlC-like cupin domain-containing protein [Aspergillus oleicola]